MSQAQLERPEVAALTHGEEEGTVPVSEIESLVDELALEDTALEELDVELERRGVDVRDDAGRTAAEPPSWANGDLASATTDALQLFLDEAGRFPLLTAQPRRSRSRSASSAATSRRRI